MNQDDDIIRVYCRDRQNLRVEDDALTEVEQATGIDVPGVF